MFVQKKYPKVAYTMTVELFQHEVEQLECEAALVNAAMRRMFPTGMNRTPTFRHLLQAMLTEARVPYGC